MDLGRMFSWPTQGCWSAKALKVAVNEFAVGLGVFEFFQFLHALVVFDALHLHLRHLLVFDLVELLAQDDVGVFEDGFDQGEQHQRVVGRLRIQQRNCVKQV
jgi:hypothetical protein